MNNRYLVSILSIIAIMTSSLWTTAQATIFTPPVNNSAPKQATGGASRGSIFTPDKGNSAPRQATGGASRGNLFTPDKGNSAPRQTTGGASRSNLFTPDKGNSTPRQATGGASRGNLFTPDKGNSAPRETTGGSSRGNLFTPDKGNSTPRETTGGSSRGDLFAPDKGNSTPRETTGGASRLGIENLDPGIVAATGPAAMIAILPQSFYGTTVSERPTMMVYIPATPAKEAVFSIKDEAGNMHYTMTIPVAGRSGIIAIKLPADAPALTVEKNYQWFLALKVDGQLSPSTPYIDGWIKRIQPNAELATAMQQQEGLKLATVLGKNGVWYDCAATLAASQIAQPNNALISKQWQELLFAVSLKEIATAPVALIN